MTNNEFRNLIKLKKHFSDSKIILPNPGMKNDTPIKVESNTTRDIFYLDTDRKSSITLSKKKIQKRHANSNTMMIRLEIDCRPHMYSDGSLSSRNHIHIFDEKKGNITYDLTGKYATLFSNTENFMTVFYEFCNMCNIDTVNVDIQDVM
jgi:hypothetical protein|nr:MAG TPA: hypothetical protein [Caudoviricetes sp.]